VEAARGDAGLNPALRTMLDLQYRFYDRVRHPSAADVAGTPGRTGSFEELGASGYLLLVTFKRDGTPVPTPVLFTADDGKVYVRGETRKAKMHRIRNNPHVRIARSNTRGKPKGPVYEGRARLLPPEEEDRAHGLLWSGYSPPMKVYEGVADRLPVELSYIEISPVLAP
jgi:PPOX class probable F420-dependent enzyme